MKFLRMKYALKIVRKNVLIVTRKISLSLENIMEFKDINVRKNLAIEHLALQQILFGTSQRKNQLSG